MKSLFRLAFGALIVAAVSSSGGVAARTYKAAKAAIIGASSHCTNCGHSLPVGVQPIAHQQKPVSKSATKPKTRAEILGVPPNAEHIDHHSHHDMRVITAD